MRNKHTYTHERTRHQREGNIDLPLRSTHSYVEMEHVHDVTCQFHSVKFEGRKRVSERYYYLLDSSQQTAMTHKPFIDNNVHGTVQ